MNSSGIGRLRCAIGIDPLSDPPVAVRTYRTRGRLQHETINPLAQPIDPNAKIIGCLGNHESVVRILEAPYPSTAKARRVFPALLDLRLPFSESECQTLFLDVRPSKGDGTQTLAVAARRRTIQKRLETYRKMGCDPLLLDQEAVALWSQSLLEQPTGPNDVTTVLRLVIALHAHGGGTLCVGQGEHLIASGNLGENVVTEVDRRLKALDIAADTPIEIRWTGPDATDRDRIAKLQHAFNTGRTVTHHLHRNPDTMLARALTTRAMTDGNLRCNLRYGPLLHPYVRRRTRRLNLVSAIVFGINGIGLILIGNHWQTQTTAYANRIRDEIVIRAERIIGNSTALRGEDAVNLAQRRVSEVMTQTQPFADLMTARLSDALETVLQLSRKHNIIIQTLDLQKDALTISANSPEWTQATAFSRELETYWSKLTLQRQWEIETSDNRTSFTITATSLNQQ